MGCLETNVDSGQGRKHRRQKEFLGQKSCQLGWLRGCVREREEVKRL